MEVEKEERESHFDQRKRQLGHRQPEIQRKERQNASGVHSQRSHTHSCTYRKDHSHDKLASWGQYRILLILPLPLIPTQIDCELWQLSCRYFFTISASSAVTLLRTQRTALCQYGLWLVQQLWKEINTCLYCPAFLFSHFLSLTASSAFIACLLLFSP